MSYDITFVKKKICFDDRTESIAVICCLVDLIQFSYGRQFVLKNADLQKSKYLWECADVFGGVFGFVFVFSTGIKSFFWKFPQVLYYVSLTKLANVVPSSLIICSPRKVNDQTSLKACFRLSLSTRI